MRALALGALALALASCGTTDRDVTSERVERRRFGEIECLVLYDGRDAAVALDCDWP